MIYSASHTQYELRARVYALSADGSLPLDEMHTYDGGSDDDMRLNRSESIEWMADPHQILINIRERSIVTFGPDETSFVMASGVLASVDFIRTDYDSTTSLGTFHPVTQLFEKPSLRTKQVMDLLRFIPEEALIPLSLGALARLVQD
jgi:hypothetical protein